MKRRLLGWMALAAIALLGALVVSSSWPVNKVDASSDTAQSSHPFRLAQATPGSDETGQAASNGVPISGTYEEPQGRFQVGIIDGYSVSSAGGSPLFQQGDGGLAYSVVRVPLSSETPLSDVGLAEITEQTLGQGEGFQAQTFDNVPGGGLQIAWTGRLSQGAAPPQPVGGLVLAKQEGSAAYLLVIAALEDAAGQVPSVAASLAATLEIL